VSAGELVGDLRQRSDSTVVGADNPDQQRVSAASWRPAESEQLLALLLTT
jgi:hypothetical protein